MPPKRSPTPHTPRFAGDPRDAAKTQEMKRSLILAHEGPSRDTWEGVETLDGLDGTETLDGPTNIEGPPRAVVSPDASRLEGDPGFADRYLQDRVLGQGGMGVVLSYHDRQIGRRVAMKRMREDTADVARFVREARIQGQLEHPSVVPVYDLALDPDGRPFFTMRRIKGLTLEEIIERLQDGAPAKFRQEHALRRRLSAFGRVCLAVHYAHEHGVLHRDLKPANVILGEFGEVYVLDWGLAGLFKTDAKPLRELRAMKLSRATMPGSLLGTPGYLSPEQALGRVDQLTPASDVYSLGAILFEMVTLTPLHVGDNPLALLESTFESLERHRRPSLRAPEMGIDAPLEEIIVKATESDRGARYATAKDLYNAIEAYLDGQRSVDERVASAQAHARAAAEGAERVLMGKGDAEAQVVALKSAVGAIALDPGNAEAMSTLVRLVTHLPDELPAAVQTNIEREHSDRWRWVGGIASLTYAATFVYLPFLAATGVTDWVPLIVAYSFLLLAGMVSVAVARSKDPSARLILVSMLLSNIGLGATAPLLGPLLLTPSMIAINTAPYALFLDARGRWLSVVTGTLVIAICIALGFAGVIPGEYAFEDGALIVRSGALHLAPLPTLLLLATLAVGQVVAAALSAARIRADFERAERRLQMQSWLLTNLARSRGRGPSD